MISCLFTVATNFRQFRIPSNRFFFIWSKRFLPHHPYITLPPKLSATTLSIHKQKSQAFAFTLCKMASTKKICVIGAGLSGMSMLRQWKQYKLRGVEDLPDVICLEKQEDAGGQWFFNWRSGIIWLSEIYYVVLLKYCCFSGQYFRYTFKESC